MKAKKEEIMRTQRTLRTVIGIAGLVVLIFVTGIRLGSTNVEASTEPPNTAAGSWIVRLTPDPTSGLPPEVNIGSFGSDGRMINIEANGNASAGEWRRTGSRQFGMTIVGLLIENGQPIRGKARAVCEIAPRGGEFDCQFRVEYFDADGNLIFGVDGTAHGNRFDVEPL